MDLRDLLKEPSRLSKNMDASKRYYGSSTGELKNKYSKLSEKLSFGNMYAGCSDTPFSNERFKPKKELLQTMESFASGRVMPHTGHFAISTESTVFHDVVDNAFMRKTSLTENIIKQMGTSLNVAGSIGSGIKMYQMLDHCQNIADQSNTSDIIEKTSEKYPQSQYEVYGDDFISLQSSCNAHVLSLIGVSGLDNCVQRSDGCNVSISGNILLVDRVDQCGINTMDASQKWQTSVAPILLENPKLSQFQIKYQLNNSHNKTPERTVSSKFLRQVKDRKAEALQNNLKNKKPLDTGNSVTSCEDKITRLKELLSKKQPYFNADELKQVPRNLKSKDISPSRNLKDEISGNVKNDTASTSQCYDESMEKSRDVELIPTSLVSCHDNSLSVPTTTVGNEMNLCSSNEDKPAVTEETIEELEKLMDRLSLVDCGNKSETVVPLIQENHPAVIISTAVEPTVDDKCVNPHQIITSIVPDTSSSNKYIKMDDSIPEVLLLVNTQLNQQLQTAGGDTNSNLVQSSDPVRLESFVEISASPDAQTQDCSATAEGCQSKTDNITETKINILDSTAPEGDHRSKGVSKLASDNNLLPNTNHTLAPLPLRSQERLITKSRGKKNHRATCIKTDESKIQLADGGNELNGQERLSLMKEKHLQHSKVCDKKHKNEHCIKKHRHKQKENFKKDIIDELNYDSNNDASEPIYFSPETLQLHKGVKKRNKWPILSKVDASKNEDKTANGCRLPGSVEKCVNFISKLPSQISPIKMCNGNSKVSLSSTESDDCMGFDEIKGKFKHSGSECESDDSFVIVFSDGKKEEHKQDTSSATVKKPKHRVRLPSECDSEDSFVICFEGDGNTSTDDCYGNDEVYSDSDSSASDMESDTESEHGEETNSEMSSDECETIMEQPPKLKSCLKRSKSPKSEKAVVERKVQFNSKPKVHKMVVWSYAYRQARIGLWERYGRDAERFKQRIRDTEVCLEWVFKREHRNRIFFQRFRPLLMRSIREEKEAKAREAKRLKEEEEKQKIEMEQEKERLRLADEEKQQLEEEDVNLSERPDKGHNFTVEQVTTSNDILIMPTEISKSNCPTTMLCMPN